MKKRCTKSKSEHKCIDCCHCCVCRKCGKNICKKFMCVDIAAEEIAKLLGTSVRTFYRRMEKKKPFFKVVYVDRLKHYKIVVIKDEEGYEYYRRHI